MENKIECHNCLVCSKKFPVKNLVPCGAVREAIFQEIKKDFPTVNEQDYICHADLTQYRIQYVHKLVKSEKGELTDLEKEVLDSMQHHELISKNVETEYD